MKIQMNTPRLLIGIFCLAFSSLAEQPAPAGAMNQLSSSSEQELNKSIQELSRLRDQIATEKLPLAQGLTASEEKLVLLRRTYEQNARMVDAGNLDLTTIKNGIKARQDELTYVGNLLDEYARSFESKINVSELQYCGESLDAAKKAAENTTLSPEEKFISQVVFLKGSVERLFNAIGGMRFPGVGVDMKGNVEEGQFAVIGPVALFRANTGKRPGW